MTRLPVRRKSASPRRLHFFCMVSLYDQGRRNDSRNFLRRRIPQIINILRVPARAVFQAVIQEMLYKRARSGYNIMYIRDEGERRPFPRLESRPAGARAEAEGQAARPGACRMRVRFSPAGRARYSALSWRP